MKLINARQAWTDAQHESNASITAAAIDSAQSAKVKTGGRIGKREVQFPAMGSEKGEEAARFSVPGQRISISETRRAPIGRSTARAAHLATMGKVQRAIGTLPFQVQQFGHYLYHPCMTVVHMLNAEKLIWADTDFSSLTDAKAAKVHCLITCALQSYKAEANGGTPWGPARVAEGMLKLYGIAIEPKHWDRDWKEVWEFLRAAIQDVDIQAQQPVWQVIHAEKEESAA
ncbi:hypothetical protein SAMN04489802_2824 [Pseudomonas chlororaphis]|uniref:hypothetical protein n=1 Tax=Pseudomonas chlororaphis TaxID=587753 RepID=UPI00087C31CE|nr:hypothetical protein [Pseudomonas chlororaphis]AZD67589.1 hypothetical protein C4K17_3703 [Pseudomonas chlororaphis subsp. aurantiaca]QIT23559.1 hypothetical protein HCN09_18110 [Pseudomonas chlororaphis subsp. aurantiaca]WDH01652.1 hypothetical protein PUP57_19235 [Pseudomonas chlororaphis]WDH09500.1 hypothetical protein PUP64_27775 [Pseudomonas chlororaphis]SDS98111.1 hypothetical protein SAMN04489802_2824 [Pseudomonas chlororaphis]